jgi:phosphocarrier protein FPr
MKQVELVVQNPTGLHARPAKVLVNLARQFQSEITLLHKEKRANAKSMVSVLTLGATSGSRITVQASGVDEDDAVARLEAAIRDGLGERAPETAPAAPAAAPAVPEPPVRAAPAHGALRGTPAAPGIALGPVFQYQQVEYPLEVLEEMAQRAQMSLEAAMLRAKQQLEELYHSMLERKMGEEAGIFEAHIELLEDPELAQTVNQRVQAGQSSVRAWKTAIDERAALVAALPDPLLAARGDDLRDVGKRVLRLMLGMRQKTLDSAAGPVIVVAEELSPSETAAFDPRRVLGFVISTGGPTAHIAILARALGLPAVVAADEAILALADGTPAILNGGDGTLLPNPTPQARAEAEQAQAAWLEQRRVSLAQAGLPAVTLDGHTVDVTANAGSAADALEALKKGADGIGLLRTEFLFLQRDSAPGEEEQYQVYRAIAETMKNLPVIVRTLDIGGDKPVAYIRMKPELNPFLGERGIRLCLNRPQLFRDQLRAILRAAPHGNLRIMFPMIADVSEVRRARALIEELRGELNAPPVQIGIMVEIPSAALLADAIAPEVDFFSIGTNDLTQYTLAVDRGHATLAAMHDALHPGVLRLIAMTVEAAHRHGKRADLCGELGSDPAAVPILLGLGLDELSVSIPAVPTVKAQVRALRLADVKPLAQKALACATPQEVRRLAKAFLDGATPAA